jgi:hypothetical protein
MTNPVFGRAMPIHFTILQFIGWHVGLDTRILANESERIAKMRTGHSELCQKTGQDFGYDLAKWREFLIERDKEFGYTHAYAFGSVDKEVRRAIADPEFIRLAKCAADISSPCTQRGGRLSIGTLGEKYHSRTLIGLMGRVIKRLIGRT